MTAMTEICMLRYEAFNTAGQAGKIKAIPLADMAASYN
jgi:fructose-bisphosphate aldolase class II